MSKLFIEESSLTAIGDAIRNKTGGSELLSPAAMVTAIESIEGGGGGTELPDEAFVITGNCHYRLGYDGWNWYIEMFGNKITTNSISNLGYTFMNSTELTEIPFDLNISKVCKTFELTYSGCTNLKSLPRIYGELSAPTGNYGGTASMASMFANCQRLKEIPYDYFYSFGGDAFWEASQQYYGNRNAMFQNCQSIRQLPDISMLKTTQNQYNCLYHSMLQNCHALDKVVDLPVLKDANLSGNGFNNTFFSCGRLKSMTFELDENGNPIVANGWKSQTIDLTKRVGYNYQESYITGLNSGLTTDTRITDDASYQALKDNPDSWTTLPAYSRYNHDSAVDTINTLPDVSGSGSTNTIKFEGICGELTDAGAINTLTEAEIAVAAAKGWTVTLS